jgi:hypothetical protein
MDFLQGNMTNYTDGIMLGLQESRPYAGGRINKSSNWTEGN